MMVAPMTMVVDVMARVFKILGSFYFYFLFFGDGFSEDGCDWHKATLILI